MTKLKSLSGVCDFPLRHLVGAQIDEHPPVPQTHRAERRIARAFQRVGPEHCRSCAFPRHLLLYLQPDQRGFEFVWVSRQ
jgi:hypothetical protein